MSSIEDRLYNRLKLVFIRPTAIVDTQGKDCERKSALCGHIFTLLQQQTVVCAHGI